MFLEDEDPDAPVWIDMDKDGLIPAEDVATGNVVRTSRADGCRWDARGYDEEDLADESVSDCGRGVIII